MTSLPHAEHAVRRKAYAPHYNLPHLTQFQPEVNDSVIKVLNVSHALLSSVPPGDRHLPSRCRRSWRISRGRRPSLVPSYSATSWSTSSLSLSSAPVQERSTTMPWAFAMSSPKPLAISLSGVLLYVGLFRMVNCFGTQIRRTAEFYPDLGLEHRMPAS